MANSLLDFVMALVRDPESAARYAADPGGALAAANLQGVTSADVENLIPVVSESLSMNLSGSGVDPFDAEPAGNVWASGAATAAFDAFGAFDDQLPDDAPQLDRISVDAFEVESQVPATVGADADQTAVYTAEPLVVDVMEIETVTADEVPLLGPDDVYTDPDQPGAVDLFD